MKFYYLNRHRSCPNYIGTRPTGFAMFTGTKGDNITSILPIPVLLFVIKGKVTIHCSRRREIVVGEGEMMAAVCPESTYTTISENCLCIRLYLQGNGLTFCHRIVNTGKMADDAPFGKVLKMIPEVQAIMRQMIGYITDGLLCCDIHAMKQRELAAILQAYYQPSELNAFVAPIYTPGTHFYNEVMKMAHDYRSVQEMATAVNMSYPSFIRHFRKVFHETPSKWQAKNRMKQLKDLMENTTLTEREVADNLKFTTVQNMRAFCKTHSKLTPMEIRAQKAKMGA